MAYANRYANLVLGGGGVKGIAFAGALDVAEKNNYFWKNIAGVSSGALVGAYIAAGYNAKELRVILDQFDFGGIELEKLEKKVAVISRYLEFRSETRNDTGDSIHTFLSRSIDSRIITPNDANEFTGYRGNLLKNIITFSKEGCLLDGDYLEEWVSKMLRNKGIRRFADLRGGVADRVNPRGYKVRMTAVDANRGRIIVLPDDMIFYNINPDDLEVSKAVRMSTCVPFAFKPVELIKKEGKDTKTYHIVDGGVLDSFPAWLIDCSDERKSLFGFKLNGGEKKKLFSMDTPVTIYKKLIAAVHDLGIPKDTCKTGYIATADTSKVPFLDFGLSEEDKNYLYNEGKKTAQQLFMSIQLQDTDVKKYRSNFPGSYHMMSRKYW